jgi:hypothetical protein
MYVLVIAVGAGVGLLVRPLIQGGSIPNPFAPAPASTLSTTPKIRCPGPEGSELALEEYVDPAAAGEATTAGVASVRVSPR